MKSRVIIVILSCLLITSVCVNVVSYKRSCRLEDKIGDLTEEISDLNTTASDVQDNTDELKQTAEEMQNDIDELKNKNE